MFVNLIFVRKLSFYIFYKCIYCICKLIYGKLSIVETRLECDASNFLLLVFVSIKCVVLRTHTDIHKYMKKHVIQSQIIYRSSKFFGGIIIQSISVYFLRFRETENGMKWLKMRATLLIMYFFIYLDMGIICYSLIFHFPHFNLNPK